MPTLKNSKQISLGELIYLQGGFPCQPFSVAGKQGAQNDDRYLWPEMLRVIKECRPSWIIGENVTGIINLALDKVCIDLESQGYEVWPVIIPACAVNAPHRRDRVWIIAHANSYSESNEPLNEKSRQRKLGTFTNAQSLRRPRGHKQGGEIGKRDIQNLSEIGASVWCKHPGCNRQRTLANTDGQRCDDGRDSGEKRPNNSQEKWKCKKNKPERHKWQSRTGENDSNGSTTHANSERPTRGAKNTKERQRIECEKQFARFCNDNDWQDLPKPGISRGDDGFPERLDRVKALGNAIVPQVAYEIIKLLPI